MKRGITIFLSAVLSASLWAAEPGFEFSGVLTTDGKTKIALTDKSTGTTRWVDQGGEFNGFVVARYDARGETITLQRAGQELRLSLVAPKEPAGNAAAPTTVAASATPATTPRTNARPPPETKVSPPPPAAVLAPDSPTPTGRTPAAGTTGTGGAAVTHAVKTGETVDSIARDAGVTPQHLQRLNPNLNPGSLQTGQVVRIR